MSEPKMMESDACPGCGHGKADDAEYCAFCQTQIDNEHLRSAITGYLAQLDRWFFERSQTPPAEVVAKPAGYEGALRKLRWAVGGDHE